MDGSTIGKNKQKPLEPEREWVKRILRYTMLLNENKKLKLNVFLKGGQLTEN